jgi:predicted acyl esterase
VSWEGPEASDLTGLLAAVAGALLIGLAAWIPFAGRSEAASTARRRWVNRVVAVPAVAVVFVGFAFPVAIAVFELHKPRADVGSPPSAAYRDVSFESTDGLKLSGWYRPSRNGATVLLVHGGGGDRTGAEDHARMLDRHGYGILMYDSRGRGESEGSPNSYGWDWEKDAAGAMGWLATQDAGRIGALGLSSGADTVLDVASTRDDLDAVVSDGAAGRTLEDFKRIDDRISPQALSGWVMFEAIDVMSGDEPSRTLEDLVPSIDAPTLLVSAGRTVERDANVRFDEVANDATEHWNLPEAGHTSAVRDFPEEYEEKVVGFLDGALLRAA